MRLEQLLSFFETSPAVKLLRSQQAAFVIDFLHNQFKESSRITLPMSEFLSGLRAYQETVHESYPDVLRDKAEQYLAAWCTGESRWLHRFLETGRSEPIFQLTPHTEDVFLFLDRALQKDLGVIGTDSRLRLVISTLADLVAGASDDPDVHLKHLREERARIDAEIARVERDGVGARYEPGAVRERFAIAVAMLKQLMSDFRAVEDRFREITKDVQRRQSQGQDSRGSILEYALDSEDLLKKEDQGVSFYEFVRFILSPVQQERLQKIITELGRLDAIAQQIDGLATVRRMVPSLLAEAEKVMRTNQRLSATLRRLLDSQSSADRQRLGQLLSELKSLLATHSPTLAEDPLRLWIEIDTEIELSIPFSRTFWSNPTSFTTIDLTTQEVDSSKRLEAFRMLAGMHRLDWRSLRLHVRELIERRGTTTISQILNDFPLKVGVVEILAYIQIAREDGHLISSSSTEIILVKLTKPHERTLEVTVPLVHFTSSTRAS